VFVSLQDKLARTRLAFKRVEDVFRGGTAREAVLDELAETLILADVGVAATERIIDGLRARSFKADSPEDLRRALKEGILAVLDGPEASSLNEPVPAVFMIVGINGGGKTTTAAKLARRAQKRGRSAMMAAADTFRAAAQEQLVLWGKKLDIPVVKGQYGADPASVVFDALRSFRAQGRDLLLVDTAGRIHTNTNLMNELEKIRRVISRELPEAPHESLLVLDAGVGQNAAAQAREFLRFSGLTGIVLSKLDGTAKGGSVIAVADELKLPIRFIGLGESEEDLVDFSPGEFVEALLS
jgi:fused signal recognition particle receptor